MTLRARKFTYAYKTSDGVRHEAEILALSRDNAFAELRKRGIRPIKVIDTDADKGWRRTLTVASLLLVATTASVAWMVASCYHAAIRPPSTAAETTLAEEVRKPGYYAKPLVRQPLHGDARRRAEAYSNSFEHASESFLARFAEPGARVADTRLTAEIERDFPIALESHILIAEGEHTEFVDLKRIVCGMKREMRAYLAGGGTIRGYVDELVKRQNAEHSLREKAARRLRELIRPDADQAALGKAYDYLLKANATLRARGIEPLDVPYELQDLEPLTESDIE